MRICVYGAASPSIDPEYMEKTVALGKELARRGHSLVFGGGARGLMGAVARGVHEEGGYVLGVAPRFFLEESAEVLDPNCDEMIHTDTMRQRKQIMEENADGFIVLPGGVGTFEEFFEILTLKQLCRHSKPIAVYNLNGYYDEIRTALDAAISKKFIRESCRELYLITDDIKELFCYLETDKASPRTLRDLKEG